MPKIIEKADATVVNLLTTAMTRYHPDLVEADAAIAALMVHPPTNGEGEQTGPAIVAAGCVALACIKVTNAKERVLTGCDAILQIAADLWEPLSLEQRTALLDHELEHLVVRRDGAGRIVQHDDLRPKLSTQPDDWSLSGFAAVVSRHGQNAVEVSALRQLNVEFHEVFAFMEEDAVPALVPA